MKVAAYQAPLLSAGSMDAISFIAAQVKVCETSGVEILCCPEAVLGGLADYTSCPSDLAISVASGQLRRVLTPIASRAVTTIVGFTEAGAGAQVFNSAAVFSEGEVVGVYRKLHPAINRSVYEPGNATPIFKIGGMVFAILICRDSTYPELAHGMATRGATVLFVPTNNALAPTKGGADVVEHALRMDVTLAAKNSLSVIRADVAGRLDGLASYGSSAIVAHDGTVLQVARQLEPDLLIADISPPVDTRRKRSNIEMEPTRGRV